MMELEFFGGLVYVDVLVKFKQKSIFRSLPGTKLCSAQMFLPTVESLVQDGGRQIQKSLIFMKILLHLRKSLCLSFSLIRTKIPLRSFIHSFHQLHVTNSWSVAGSMLGGHRKYHMHKKLLLRLLLTEGGRH